MSDKYFPTKYALVDLPEGGFALIDAHRAEFIDAEICRFTHHGDLSEEMKREFADCLTTILNRYAEILRSDSDDD